MNTLSPEKLRILQRRLKGPAPAEPKQRIPMRPDPQRAPLSYAQRQIWWLNEMAPGCPAYNLPVGYRLRGHIDPEALEESLNRIIARHESLRTIFISDRSEPVQIVQAECQVPLALVCLDASPLEEREQRLHTFATAEAMKPFDLTRLPLFRASLCRLSEAEHVLILVVHHIVSDGLSMGLLMRELNDYYVQLTTGTPAPTPELRIQYPDFCAWETATEAARATQIPYWEKQLQQPLPVLELPSNYPRPAVQSFGGSNVFFQLQDHLMDSLTQLGRKEGCTFFMVVLTAFQAFLQRYTGAEEVVIGSPITVRPTTETEELIGNFVNMLALRCDLSGDPSLPELLRRTRALTLDAFANKDLPFGQLVQRLSFPRDPSRNPVFQVILQVLPESKLRLGGLEVTPFHFDFGFAQFDLALHLYQDRGGYFGRLEYCKDLFRRGVVERWAQNLLRLLESMVQQPDLLLSQLELLASAERQRLLLDWNRTQTDYPRDKCLHHLVAAAAQRTPDAVAVEFDGLRLNYRELNERADALAGHLSAAGARSDTIVALCVRRSLAMVVGVLGILKAGAAYLPLDPTHPKERLHFMLEDSQAHLTVTQPELADLFLGRAATLIHLRSTGELVEPGGICTPNPASAEDLAYIIYTSGSTGKPKGVQVCHRSVINLLTSIIQQLELSASDVVLAVTTLSFDIATAELFLPLVLGARVVIVSHDVAADGQRLVTALEDSKATFLQPTPATWRLLLAAGWRGSPRLKMVSTGEPLPPDLATELLPKGASLWNLYGPTETTIWSTGTRVTASSRTISIGRPLGNTQIYILDACLRPVPLGAVGELWIGGDGLARGYVNRPDLTAERFIRHPFDSSPGARLYRTGDLARYQEDGTIECLGRTDYQVKIRGFRIELGEIETVLRTHEHVTASVVVPARKQSGEELLVAYVVPRNDTPSPAELRAFLKSKLPDYMIPTGFAFLDGLPLTSSGKIDRRALPIWSQEKSVDDSQFIRPRSPVELRVMQVWERVLGVKPIGMRDSFFDLGGHSLLAVRLVSEISKALDCDLRVLTLLQNPTIELLARSIPSRRPPRREPALFSLTETGKETPLFFTGAGSWEFSLAGLLRNTRPMFALDVPLPLDVLRAAAGNDTGHYPTVEQWAETYTQLIQGRVGSGPCLLAGHCFNGVLAFEVAHQLQRRGSTVDGIFLLDTWLKAPMYLRRVRRWIAKHARNTWQQGWGYLHRKTVSRCREAPGRLKTMMEANAQAPRQLFFDDSACEVPWALTERVILNAAGRYRVRPLPCPGVLFLAQEGAPGFDEQDGRARAAALFPAGLDIVEVPGGHVSIFDESHRRCLADQFQAALSRF